MKHVPEEWLQAVLRVRAGTLSAAQAARSLGVSRKTYYQWEARALRGMKEALTQQPPGRPPKEADTEAARLRAQLEQSERERTLLEQRIRIQRLLVEANNRSKKK